MTRLAVVALASLCLVSCGKDDDKPAPGDGPKSPPVASSPADPAAAGGYGYAAKLGSEVDKRAGDAIKKGRQWILGKRNEATGSWPGAAEVGSTALVAAALAGTIAPEAVRSDPVVTKALDFLASKQAENGAIFGNPQFVNYETSAAILAFSTAKSAAHATAQAKARDFLASSQVAGDESDASYGGFPYQSKKDPTRPTDISNQQFAATALHDAGLPKDHEVWKRMLVYLSRVQNRSETNKFVVKKGDREIVSGDDGGAVYAPGFSMADVVKRPDGKFEAKSYGSVTYALLKCLLFAGVKPDDPRVQAAIGWLERNYTVERNPGRENAEDPVKAGQEGLYYYFLTMARAAAEYEKATGREWKPKDASGQAHDWRRELASKLASLQGADGSWKNPVDRWEEADPVIVTGYALQTLAICQGRLP